MPRWNAWLAIRFPVVWRSRAWLFVSIGLLATAVSLGVARTMPVSTATLPTLSAIELWFTVWTFTTFGVVLLAMLDVARRTAPVFSRRAAVALFGCMAVSAAAIQLPQLVFVRALLPRIAALESASSLDALLRVHAGHRFWRCMDTHDAIAAIDAQRAAIARDLERYGLRTAFKTEPEFRLYNEEGCDNPTGESLLV